MRLTGFDNRLHTSCRLSGDSCLAHVLLSETVAAITWSVEERSRSLKLWRVRRDGASSALGRQCPAV